RRPEMRELILFASPDQGCTWHQEGAVTPETDAFRFFAPADGLYWFRVAVVDRHGRQDPADPAKVAPNQKVLIDTLPPVLRIVPAQREGEDVVVAWEVQEDHPDWNTLKLEYRPADAPASAWSPAPVKPGPGRPARFRLPAGGPVALRLQMQDL